MKQYTDGYFLCVPCAGGYYSFYREFYDADTAKHVYIIKGSFGIFTHTILSAVAEKAVKLKIRTEKIYSQRAPGLLEGLALPDIGIYLFDGNYPRPAAEKYPVALETLVSTDEFLSRDYLTRNAGAIKLVSKVLESEQKRSMNYLSAVKSLYSDSAALISDAIDREKICRYAARFAAREFPSKKKERSKAKNRFLSAITPYGIWTNYAAAESAGRLIAIEDSLGVASSMLITAIKKEAEERGLECILCRCPTKPEDKAEHIIIPEAGITFFTSNRYHPAPSSAERHIHMTRFIDRDKSADCRFRLTFNKKASRELIDEAVKAESSAKEMRDIVASYYEAAADEAASEEFIEKLCTEIFS